MNEITYSTYGLKQYMKSKIERAVFGTFYVVDNRVEYTVCGVTEKEAEDYFTDDVNELKKGNVNSIS